MLADRDAFLLVSRSDQCKVIIHLGWASQKSWVGWLEVRVGVARQVSVLIESDALSLESSHESKPFAKLATRFELQRL